MEKEMIFCQSCSMPLKKEEQFGTNRDRSKNREYCVYCYKDGEFTNPELTMEEMIDRCSEVMADRGDISLEEAKAILNASIPKLKRWRK